MAPRRGRTLVLFSVSAVLLVALAAANRGGFTAGVDAAVAAWFRDYRGVPAADAAARALSFVANAPVSFVVAGAFALYLARAKGLREAAAPLFIVVTAVGELLLKLPWSRLPRFSDIASAFGQVVGVPLRGLYWFPSGHVARMTFLAYMSFRFLPRPVGAVVLLGAVMTGAARMLLDNHRISDVVGGLLLGVFAGACADLWLILARAARLRRLASTIAVLLAYGSVSAGALWLALSLVRWQVVEALAAWLVLSLGLAALWALRWIAT